MVLPVTLVSLEAKGMVLKHNLLEIMWGWGCVWYLRRIQSKTHTRKETIVTKCRSLAFV